MPVVQECVLRDQALVAPGPRSPQPGAPHTFVTTPAVLERSHLRASGPEIILQPAELEQDRARVGVVDQQQRRASAKANDFDFHAGDGLALAPRCGKLHGLFDELLLFL